ncbi:MAG: Elongation factor P--(R)-beta-lysine ligase [Chlamydiia bacterium]|nr:Elongation factor P--(R)-beta-lysine ligase [Chlamydiia bacterium]
MDRFLALRKRAEMLGAVRTFFAERGVMEVDTPLLARAPHVSAYIDPIEVSRERYLVTSPEHAMKRLIAAGIGDIYQMSSVFREDEAGSNHNPEFTMIEYYRHAMAFEPFLEEVLDLIALFVGKKEYLVVSYDEAFERFADGTCDVPGHFTDEERRFLVWADEIEPKLGRNDTFTVITNYPPEDAALAQVVEEGGKQVAKRFEIYYQGKELANGYLELGSKEANQKRFEAENQKRIALGKPPLPLDTRFLDDLGNGLPEQLHGIALGFDRLLMLQLGTSQISDVLSFDWARA